MTYKGIELNEFTSEKPVLFDPPKLMLVWNDGDSEPATEQVFALPRTKVRLLLAALKLAKSVHNENLL